MLLLRGIVSVMLFAGLMGGTLVHAKVIDGKYIGSHQTPSCRFRYSDGIERFSKREVSSTIKCAVRRWEVPGGVDVALCIARRESGLNWYADNPVSTASGVYQFVEGTWSTQVSARREFIHKQELNRSVWNARSNVMIAIRLAHGSGWGPWGGGC